MLSDADNQHNDNNIMYCDYCGKKIRSGAKYCPYCGKKLDVPKNNDSIAPAIDTDDIVVVTDEHTSGKSKKKILLIVIPIIVVLSIVCTIYGASSYAFKLADSEDFETASKYSFIVFWDKDFTKYVEAGIALNNKEYVYAKNEFEELGEYRNSEELYKESVYLESIEYYKLKMYFDAYDGFEALSNYKDAESYLDKVMMDAYMAAENAFEDKEYQKAKNLFELSKGSRYEDYIKVIDVQLGNKKVTTLRDILDFEPAKKCLLQDDTIAQDFLRGSWHSRDKEWYFTMKDTGDTSFNIPWLDHYDYYFIEDGKYYVYNEDHYDERQLMYEFYIEDWNTIIVVAKENDEYYHLYRD